MAKDLIPPPSPAGRPSGEPGQSPPPEPEARPSLFAPAEDEPAARTVPEPPPVAAPEPPAPSPYRSRFGFLTGGLIGVGLAVVALLVGVLAAGTGSSVPANWSRWKPTASDGYAAVRQIADHVSPKYRLANGNQLVAVLSGPLEIADVPLSVAIRTAPTGGDIDLLDGKGVMFTLNGMGPHGSIRGGAKSAARHRLLRREALELALYTFRYIDDVDMVVALLPPPPPEKGEQVSTEPTQALFYRPGDLKPELARPIDATIAPRTPRPETIGTTEAHEIDALTLSNLFQASFQQGQNARAFIVLERPPS